MKYIEFKNQIRPFSVFSSSQLDALKNSNGQTLHNQLSDWVKRGLVLRLRKNLYILNEQDRAVNPSLMFLGNQIYVPSYISMEWALSYYGLIPEAVFTITSVTTKKTMSFHNPLGTFRYHHLKPDCFFGFRAVKDEAGLPFFLAAPEKALIDFIYLNLDRFGADDGDIFEESYRLQNLEQVNVHKLKTAAKPFANKKLRTVIKNLCHVILEAKKTNV